MVYRVPRLKSSLLKFVHVPELWSPRIIFTVHLVRIYVAVLLILIHLPLNRETQYENKSRSTFFLSIDVSRGWKEIFQ